LAERVIAYLACLWLVGTGLVHAEKATHDNHQFFNKAHQAGIRLGVWANNGESPPQRDSLGTFETNFKGASFYFEGYFAYRLAPRVMLEFSAGVVNRGSVTFKESKTTNIGSVLVHPILLQVKLYPLALLETRFQPYFVAGGGLYYGRRSVQFTTSGDIYYYGLAEQSGTDFNYTFGGGIDWLASKTIGMEVGVKYMPIEFSRGLQTIRNYDALAFTVGVKYLYTSKKR